MIADELQYRININDLTFEEADLINDIAYDRYVIEVTQEEQLRYAGVPADSPILTKYRGTAADKLGKMLRIRLINQRFLRNSAVNTFRWNQQTSETSVIERVWGDPHQDKSHRRTGCQTALLLNMGGSCSNLQTLLHIQKMEGENTGCERKIIKKINCDTTGDIIMESIEMKESYFMLRRIMKNIKNKNELSVDKK